VPASLPLAAFTAVDQVLVRVRYRCDLGGGCAVERDHALVEQPRDNEGKKEGRDYAPGPFCVCLPVLPRALGDADPDVSLGRGEVGGRGGVAIAATKAIGALAAAHHVIARSAVEGVVAPSTAQEIVAIQAV
jgi:hypothetical protein